MFVLFLCITQQILSCFCFPAECVLHQLAAVSPGGAQPHDRRWWQQVSGGREQQTQAAGVQLRSYQTHEAHLDVHSGKPWTTKGPQVWMFTAALEARTFMISKNCFTHQFCFNSLLILPVCYVVFCIFITSSCLDLLDQSSMVAECVSTIQLLGFVTLPLHFVSSSGFVKA